MSPNDDRADAAQRQAIECSNQGRLADAAWAMTAAAHLTTAAHPARRGNRALASVALWRQAGRLAWSQDMAAAFSQDRCIPPDLRQRLRARSGPAAAPEGLGISLVGAGAGTFSAIRWGVVGLCVYAAWKAARYLVTGRAGDGGSTKLPPAWRVHG